MLSCRPARLHTQAGENDSLESISGLLKRLQIRALEGVQMNDELSRLGSGSGAEKRTVLHRGHPSRQIQQPYFLLFWGAIFAFPGSGTGSTIPCEWIRVDSGFAALLAFFTYLMKFYNKI
jgi:hypothetical protein